MRKYDFQKNSLIQVLLDVQETFAGFRGTF